MSEEPIDLVLVEDDEVDAMAVDRALAATSLPLRRHLVVDGEEALERLRALEEAGARLLVLLDLNLPRLPGIEMLRRLRADPALRGIPVFVLTTSKDERDRFAAYGLQVAGYLVKDELGRRMEKLGALLQAYCEAVRLP